MKLKNVKLSGIMIVVFAFMMSVMCAFASDGKKRLVDNANLLNSSEYENISSKLDEVSERQGYDIVIVTEKNIGSKSPQDYADDYYDYNGYGIGEDNSGILLLISMKDRDWHVSTSGKGINAFTDAGIKYISNKFLPDLKDGDYADAFETFVNQCDKFITKFKSDGKAYDSGKLPKEPMNQIWSISGSILAGIFLSWVTVSYMKKQLKTVCKKAQADDYVRENSLCIKNSRDIFLYSSITRRARPKSSSGSSTHTGSSGHSHGGGGGKF